MTVKARAEAAYHRDSRRILATLIRLLGAFCRQLGSMKEARQAYEKALPQQMPEKRFIERRLATCTDSPV
ncbi:hypothetical protein JTY93_19870 [Pseudomonas hygromyciniae]|uniref:Tetratricopeptide repeat protein n=1 Tax=Pseudomonas hygromyciniae TaxID=2812000 RepID=A0ABX7K7D5_9PSED|nr:hypothetical protein [Pseudomonas hygromyciniae]MBN0980488.1 hypothetical protein [Pseudomonas hygromyciniae]QSB42432.1 hypothetical protein JTY93_19870 [Pseudomonas hygromyciniae]